MARRNLKDYLGVKTRGKRRQKPALKSARLDDENTGADLGDAPSILDIKTAEHARRSESAKRAWRERQRRQSDDNRETEQLASEPGLDTAEDTSEQESAEPEVRRRKKVSVDASGWAKFLGMAHFVLGTIFSAHELELTPPEAEEYGKAAADVARHYKMPLSPKLLDWMALASVAWAIEKPKFAALAARKGMEKMKKKMSAAMPPGGNSQQAPQPQPAAGPDVQEPNIHASDLEFLFGKVSGA